MTRLRVAGALADALAAAGIEEGDGSGGLVFATDPAPPGDFAAVEAELLDCFRLSREAASGGGAVVYLLSQPDLLGQRGALGAMRATALLSAMRSLAFEGARDGVRANAIALGDGGDPLNVATWVRALLTQPGVTGELVRVGAVQFGKLVP